MSEPAAVLALEDGRVFRGTAFGATGTTDGEVVFNTSMTGYQEVLTDPSYAGQLVCMTYPLIGNYGINPEDGESALPQVAGFIIKELSPVTSNWRSTEDLGSYLQRHGIIGIQGIDTRALTRHLRTHGARKAVIATGPVIAPDAQLVQAAADAPGVSGIDLVARVTCAEPYDFSTEGRWRVVAIDAGIKTNILRNLTSRGCHVTVVPASFSPQQIMALRPQGLFVSNGPGDPDTVGYLIDTLRQLLGRLPIFGICLGHQVLALAAGATCFKLKFGHHGGNHPVQDLETGKVAITAQNHGFAVSADSLPEDWQLTHVNLNDRTVEGMQHRRLPVFSIQYHPEAAPGPHDATYLFDRFIALMQGAGASQGAA